ncbi:hypothetical protein BJV82DRAFT_508249 [Fennellomyces sp. T-0311]|nr:hypothetical protein BJV82DRAFT_508249 [Fennellomyces sp. T-0311]
MIIAPIIVTFFIVCRVDTHMRIYIRDWLARPQPVVIEDLSHGASCFEKLPDEYQQGVYRHHYNFIPGHRLQDDTCFGFASMLRPSTTPEPTVFHTRFDEFGLTELATVQSFLATQHNSSRLVVWTDSNKRSLESSPHWHEVENDPRVTVKVSRNMELIPLLSLYQYGGVWFEPTTFFVRELTPLLELEWVAQADCFTSVDGNPFIGTGMLHFRENSPYLCELIAEAKEEQKITKVNLGKLYYRVYQRILRNGIKPWMVVPWCYTAPSKCKQSNSVQSPFAHGEEPNMRRWIDSAFAYYWKDPRPDEPSGNVYEYLMSKYHV